MAHSGRARVNAISTALPDSQLRLGGEGREGGKEGRWKMRERCGERRREEIVTVCLVDESVRG